ncbi:mammalian cell entry protein [Mycobacterium intracellulare subsp. yongonense]|nr:mammalian cell entry protein [Mycobacterium intracellulare subsp. yongonense]
MGTFALLAVFAQFRVSSEQPYRAEFSDVSGLKTGDFVRIAGVEVGKVQRISVMADAKAVVDFTAEPSVVLTQGTGAAIRWENPIGDRYMALLEGAGDAKRLNPGGTIAMNRTQPALDLDTLLGGFRPLFRALNPEQVNALSGQLIAAFQGEGATIGSFLSQAATATSALADRDELIGQVIDNLRVVMGTFGEQNKQFGTAIDSLSQLVDALAARKTDISNAIAYSNAAAGTVADLLQQARPPLKDAVNQTGRVSQNVYDDRQWFDDYLNTVEGSYKTLSRLGIMGDYFTFYLCDAVLKVNGKRGQPVYIKVAGQDTGRCGPK